MKPRRKRACAKRRVLAGNARNYIRSIDEIQPGDPVVLVCRVSTREQNHSGQLDDQEANLRDVAEGLGAVVVDVVRHVGSGWDPIWLKEPAAMAWEREATLLAETTDRFIRHSAYHSQNAPNVQARESDLQRLERCTEGVTLVTVLEPDASPTEVRSYQRKRGQRMKGRRGGRPKKNPPGYKLRRRRKNEAKIRWMSWLGFSYRQIAEATGEPRSTIQSKCGKLRSERDGDA